MEALHKGGVRFRQYLQYHVLVLLQEAWRVPGLVLWRSFRPKSSQLINLAVLVVVCRACTLF